MIFFDEKKKMQTIMSRRRKEGGEYSQAHEMKPEIVKTEDGEIDGRHVAMQDFMAAHAEKSPQKAMQALGNFIDLHMSHKDSGTGEPEV